YRSVRMGQDGKAFRVHKCRSMYPDADQRRHDLLDLNESVGGMLFKLRADPRVTPVGRMLRKFSLDELPQLFNVLGGTMSLVGPRPERPVFVEDFRRRIPGYMLRHKVKAGMTGWAQVNGWRGDTSLEKRIEYDLYYIERWSLGLDVKILAQTIWRGFFSTNAY